MKKLLFVAGIVCLLSACGTEYYSVSVINDTEKNVSYDYNGSSDTLEAKASKMYEVKAYTQAPQNINVPDGALSVTMNQKRNTYTFVDAKPFNLNVVNRLPLEVKIKADNYIDDDGSVEFIIDGGTEKNAIIYTSKPKFTSSIENHPVIIDWNFKDNTVYVTIR
jgi:hypothetical protein